MWELPGCRVKTQILIQQAQNATSDSVFLTSFLVSLLVHLRPYFQKQESFPAESGGHGAETQPLGKFFQLQFKIKVVFSGSQVV